MRETRKRQTGAPNADRTLRGESTERRTEHRPNAHRTQYEHVKGEERTQNRTLTERPGGETPNAEPNAHRTPIPQAQVPPFGRRPLPPLGGGPADTDGTAPAEHQQENTITREEVCELANNPDLLFADGFDDALIGACRIFSATVPLYDYKACVWILVTRDQMTEEDAIDFLEYNTLGTYIGNETPAFAIFK